METTPERPSPEELRTEGYTMSFYVAVCLLAALVAVSSADDAQALAIIWGTTVGLALAHVFAFRLAAALATSSSHHPDVAHLAAAQLLGAAAAAVIATIPTLVFDSPLDRQSALLAVATFLGSSGFLLARSHGAGRTRSMVFAAVVVLLALAIAVVKNELLGH